MAFKKGKKKTGGRAKGVKNKRTREWEAFEKLFMTKIIENVGIELEKLKGKDLLHKAGDFLEYFVPKLARTEITGKDGEDLNINIKVSNDKTKNNLNEL